MYEDELVMENTGNTEEEDQSCELHYDGDEPTE